MKRTRRKYKKSTLTKRQKLIKKRRLTKIQYKQLRGIHLKNFREKSIDLGKNYRDFQVQILKIFRLKGGGRRVIQINPDEFTAGDNYEIYIKHKPTRQRRLLAIGKLQDIPIRSKQMEKFGALLGGRTFNPSLRYPKRASGRWIPVNRIVRGIQKELEERGLDSKTEVRASMIPMKRYFHSKWLIYSDRVLKGNTRVKTVFVHCAVRFIYPNSDWIGKQAIRLDLEDVQKKIGKKSVRINELYKLKEKLEDQINIDLEFWHPNADLVNLVQVNGFIPILSKKQMGLSK